MSITINRAKQMAEAQRRADKAHHEKRIAWLESDEPTWVDGKPVLKSDRTILLTQSRRYLQTGEGV
jgi:hypothetical protein